MLFVADVAGQSGQRGAHGVPLGTSGSYSAPRLLVQG